MRLQRIPLAASLLGLSIGLFWLPMQAANPPSPTPRPLRDPHELNKRIPQLLDLQKRRQAQTAARLRPFHDFRFTNGIASTGITFTGRPVDDAAKHWKPAHYDHGNAVVTADVDGDGLLDLYFVRQLGGNELWQNLGQGRFENITATAGVAVADRVCVAATFADLDNDGKPDLFVSGVRKGNVVFRNLGGGRFQDLTADSGLGHRGHSSAAVPFDFDRDGRLDLFVCNVGTYTSDQAGKDGVYPAFSDAFKGHLHPERYEASLLYRNLGGFRFREVSGDIGLIHRAWSGEASACDVNEDGFPDLYVLNMQGDDRLYENQDGKRFVERTSRYFPRTPWGAMGVKFFDADRDGRLDLLVTDMHSDMTEVQTRNGRTNLRPEFEKQKSEAWCSSEWDDAFLQGASNNIFGNAFYRNLGGGRYEEASDARGLETYWPWGPSVGDLNADGHEDVFITAGMGYPFRYAINSLLLSDGGERFADAEFILGIEPRAGNRIETEYFLLDPDGPDRAHPLAAKVGPGLTAVYGSLSSRSSVMADFDGDGDLDIVTNEMIDRPQFLLSNLSERRMLRFLQVRLRGTASNRDGLGARVIVHAGGGQQTRWHDGKSGYLGQSLQPLYFGLGEATQVDRVEVTWPSGTRQTVTQAIPLNGTIEIIEASP